MRANTIFSADSCAAYNYTGMLNPMCLIFNYFVYDKLLHGSINLTKNRATNLMIKRNEHFPLTVGI
jgi:hypothetical protein